MANMLVRLLANAIAFPWRPDPGVPMSDRSLLGTASPTTAASTSSGRSAPTAASTPQPEPSTPRLSPKLRVLSMKETRAAKSK
jgi:hypothetical protein